MLIEFSVANFRSFRERQTLCMSAAPRLPKPENTFATDTAETLPSLLKVAAIYGANASGKSSLVMAMGMISKLLRRRPDSSRPLPVEPFRFDAALLDKPSEFEVHFIASGTRYQFCLGVTRERITQEALMAYPCGKALPLYERIYADGRDVYTFGHDFDGNEMLKEAWTKLTGPRSLFISQVVANSSEQMQQLRMPHAWLQDGMIVLSDNLSRWSNYAKKLAVDDTWSSGIATFLQDLDVPVTDVRFEPNGKEPCLDRRDNEDDDVADVSRSEGRTTLTHKTRLGTANFDFAEESRGTQNLIGVFLPWVMLNSTVPESYRVLVIDEFDSSLHPELMRDLVNRHLISSPNTQLIFTTHDTNLMSTNLLRRDQFWITDRDSNGATKLDSIFSFEGREDEDIERRYFEGRYRGLPIRRRSEGSATRA